MGITVKPIIAVVDDDLRILESLESLLESAGYTVRAFRDANELLAISNLEKIDCLICDICMPGVGGLELRRQIKIVLPNLPIILITGRYDLAEQLSGDSQQNMILFRKPFDGPTILSAVRESLQGSTRIK
jgi:two-component system, OmpR family, response regulator ChvI